MGAVVKRLIESLSRYLQTRRDRKRIRGWKRQRLIVEYGNRWL
jgi:hypothetical protein